MQTRAQVCGLKGMVAMLSAKRPVGVRPVESIAHTGHKQEEFSLALKTRADITRSPKTHVLQKI